MDDGKDSERLASFVQKKVLDGCIQKVGEAYLRQHDKKKTKKQEKILKEVMKAVNQYLERLGVYTIPAYKGQSYREIEDFYEPLRKKDEYIITRPVVESVERPAYVIPYIDEDGDRVLGKVEGKCVVAEENTWF